MQDIFIDGNLHVFYVTLSYFYKKEWYFNFIKRDKKNTLALPQNGGNRVSEDLKLAPSTDAQSFMEPRLLKPGSALEV